LKILLGVFEYLVYPAIGFVETLLELEAALQLTSCRTLDIRSS
jgi:hypothetical protein